MQSVYDQQRIKSGKKMKKLTMKRERKLHDFFHKVSRFITNWCVDHEIGTIVIGHNKEWKQETRMGKKNNQSFVHISFNKLI